MDMDEWLDNLMILRANVGVCKDGKGIRFVVTTVLCHLVLGIPIKLMSLHSMKIAMMDH